MKVGDVRTADQLDYLCSPSEQAQGRLSLNHPRCGRVVFERRAIKGSPPELIKELNVENKPFWVVTECERPDP